MGTDFHLRVQAKLEQALAVDAAQRGAFVQRECGGEPALLNEVLSLLPHYEQMREFEPTRPAGSVWKLPGTTTLEGISASTHGEGAAGHEPEPPFCIGQYRVLETLGRGGMGVVYRAVHATLRRPVAIKFLRPGMYSDRDRRRFAFEVEILRRLQHPLVARLVYADTIGTNRDEQPYFVMEYIEGRSLTRYAAEALLDTRQRLDIFIQICEAIEYAHQRGIIHRDLKPDNILVEPSGSPKVLDFGVAKIIAFQSALVGEERGRFIGTLQYASPEQRAGQTDDLTPRSDVYSLGLILHELLTGHLPRIEGTRALLNLTNIRLEDPARPVSEEERSFRFYLGQILTRALQRLVEQRYATAGEFGADLEQLLRAYPRLSRWGRIKHRILGLFAGGTSWSPSTAAGPLSAVLRTRIANAMQSEAYNPPASGRAKQP